MKIDSILNTVGEGILNLTSKVSRKLVIPLIIGGACFYVGRFFQSDLNKNFPPKIAEVKQGELIINNKYRLVQDVNNLNIYTSWDYDPNNKY